MTNISIVAAMSIGEPSRLVKMGKCPGTYPLNWRFLVKVDCSGHPGDGQKNFYHIRRTRAKRRNLFLHRTRLRTPRM